MTDLRERIEAAIKDAYYHARDHGGTMHTAATDATDAVLAVLAAPDEATVDLVAQEIRRQRHLQLTNGEPQLSWLAAELETTGRYREQARAVLAALGAPEQTGPDGGQGEAVSR